MKRFICGTPKESCQGSLILTSSGIRPRDGKSIKAHTTRPEAFKCFCRHLRATGHTQIDTREFLQPGGGILLLDKKNHFGAELRLGKTGTDGSKGSRFMPSKGTRYGGICI